jgi:hypothetical protein
MESFLSSVFKALLFTFALFSVKNPLVRTKTHAAVPSAALFSYQLQIPTGHIYRPYQIRNELELEIVKFMLRTHHSECVIHCHLII